MVKPFVGDVGKGDDAVLDLYVGCRGVKHGRHVLAHDGAGTGGDHIGDKAVRIHGNALHGDKQCALACLAGIVNHVGDVDTSVTHYLKRADRREQL